MQNKNKFFLFILIFSFSLNSINYLRCIKPWIKHYTLITDEKEKLLIRQWIDLRLARLENAIEVNKEQAETQKEMQIKMELFLKDGHATKFLKTIHVDTKNIMLKEMTNPKVEKKAVYLAALEYYKHLIIILNDFENYAAKMNVGIQSKL